MNAPEATVIGLDEGGRRLAGLILHAAGRGEQDMVDQLISPLDLEQLRALVGILAAQVDESIPSAEATGPAAVCHRVTTMAAKMFVVEPEAIMSTQRSRPVSDARAVAMASARALGLSYPAIAREFGKDHAAVIHAVRRSAARPRLADAATRITEHVEERYARQVVPVDNVVKLPDSVVTTAQDTTPVGTAIRAAAAAFNVSTEAVLSRDRTRSVSDARAVAMTAARLRGGTLTAIAEVFGRDHTAVLSATRRIMATAPLHDLAASIAADMPQETASPAGGIDDLEETPTTPRTQGQRQPAPGGAPARQLSVGR